ncbi:hypothetical protein LX97_02906 [Nonlabens dokdonensis]|jgi:hypothetical protein|uniref:Uncharacterized protein n=2 Tax=Nonlabens dokdonensis TaxID=328515 RepID=L7WEH5_NONDD|nr:hypothetical protein [Nonlabens dokdonensis]AGC78301.1 hypothetical protein DDD_3174 [Nonlabens dokdonensis DSW-6]PZX37811.1 hypothetical protein LX97_02906 [Nonlabens dokdonensis]
MNLQPLRIEAGWHVTYNQFYEVDPVIGFESYFEGSSLLMLQNDLRLQLIDVQWRPEKDLNGQFELQVLNFVEHFNPKTNSFDIDPNWEEPFFAFTTTSRLTLVDKLEDLMKTLPIFKDPRMILTRGVLDPVSESYRLRLKENGISTELINDILENGKANIQNHVLDHKEMTRDLLLRFTKDGINKKVKNKAKQKLTSKSFQSSS